MAVVFGSGHRELADIEGARVLHYASIPHFPIPTNIGHRSELVFSRIHGKNVLLFKGRIHPLEGYRSFYHCWLGYLVAHLGCQLLISTNACGAISTDLKVGDVMIMEDHLNCSHQPFLNALLLDDRFRTAHPSYLQSASIAHNAEMVKFAKAAGMEEGLDLISGPYDYWVLPNFETTADIQYTKEVGALVTGASTVPEQIAATLMGLKTLGLGAVSNPATGTIDGWVHDAAYYLTSAKLSLSNIKKIAWKVIERFDLDPSHQFKHDLTGIASLRLR